MRPSLILLGLLALLGTPAEAAELPGFDCHRAASSAERLVCEDPALAALDRRLTARYAAAVGIVKGRGTDAQNELRVLRAEQRGWIKGRDECWKAEDPRGCVADAYVRREGRLVARYGLEPAADVVIWQCGPSPADRLVVTRYATERPSVRLERGDWTDEGVLDRTADGTRFEASFGSSFQVDGDRATLDRPGIERVTCARR